MSMNRTVVEGKRSDMINLLMLQIATRVLSELNVADLEERVNKAGDEFFATQPKAVRDQEGVVATMDQAKKSLVEFTKMYKAGE